jgi:hypothetical protein
MNIYGIVTSPWTCHQPNHLGSWSGCQAIGTAWSDASVDLKPHASGNLLLLPLALILRCFFNLMSYQVDDVLDSHWRAHNMCQLLCGRHISVYFFFGKLSHLYTSCTMHGSWIDVLGGAPRSPRCAGYCDGMVPWGYKFTLHLMSIAISHPSLLLAFRVLLSPDIC